MGVEVKPHKNKPGKWWVRINHQRKRKSLLFSSKKAAELARAKIDAALKLGQVGILGQAPMGRDQTFTKLAEEWMERYPLVRSVSQSTMDNYGSFTRYHLIPFFGSMPVAQIDYQKIETFIAAKRGESGSARFPGKPLSEQSLRVGLVALRLILDRAVKAGILPANPAVGLVRFSRNDEDNVEPFAAEELRAILAAAEKLNPTFAAFIRLWMQSGMRIGEMSALQNQDVDLDRGQAVVRRTWSRERLGPTKTRRSRVVSFLHPIGENTPEWRPGSTKDSRRVLADLRGLPVRSLAPGAYIFGIRRPWSSAYINAEWRRMLMAAKVRYRNPEQLRHTFASTLLSRNAPLLYVQQQGGWQSAAVLLRVYARWLPQQGQWDATPAQPTIEAVSVSTDEIEVLRPIRRLAGTSKSS